MSADARAGRTADEPSARVVAAILGALAIVICLWRLRYLHEPLENDLTIRMVYAVSNVAGARYYTDLMVYGPAGTLWIYELFYRLAGASELSMYLMGCTFSVLTLGGVYRCAHLLTDVRGALVAAVTWTLISADLFTQANQPNAEVFINAALVWAFALLLDQQLSKRNAVLAGVLFFVASAVKHFVAVTPVLAAALAAVLPTRQADGGVRRDSRALRTWAVAGTTAILCWALLLGWYAATNRLPAVWDALFGASVDYATRNQSLLSNLLRGIHPFGLIPPHQLPFIGFYLCLLAAIVVGLLVVRDPRWRLIAGWALGTWASVALSGRFYPHYYLLWMPLLAIGTGALFALVQQLPRPRIGAGLRAIIALTILAIGARQALQLLNYDANAAALAKYGYPGAVFTEISTLGKRLAKSVPAEASLFEIGAHGLYFYAARPAPTPFVDSLYGIDGAFPAQYRERMLPGLLRAPPDVLVVRRGLLGPGADVAQRAFLAEVLQSAPYVEDKEFSGQHLVVLRRTPAAAPKPGG